MKKTLIAAVVILLFVAAAWPQQRAEAGFDDDRGRTLEMFGHPIEILTTKAEEIVFPVDSNDPYLRYSPCHNNGTKEIRVVVPIIEVWRYQSHEVIFANAHPPLRDTAPQRHKTRDEIFLEGSRLRCLAVPATTGTSEVFYMSGVELRLVGLRVTVPAPQRLP